MSYLRSVSGSLSRPAGGNAVSYAEAQPFIKWVFAWMGLGLLITTLITVYINANPALLLQLARNSGLFFGIIIGELVLVMVLSWGIGRLAPWLAVLLFLVYAAFNGVTLSLIVSAYTTGTIVSAFVTTTVMFGAMAFFGFTTSIDLSKISGLLFIGLIGLIVAMVVNIFLQSSALEYVLSIVGVLIFIGLTAWDAQTIKLMAVSPEVRENSGTAAKYAVFGALKLYLDFINLFLFLLRIFGRRR